jgi:hypothetical protein
MKTDEPPGSRGAQILLAEATEKIFDEYRKA